MLLLHDDEETFLCPRHNIKRKQESSLKLYVNVSSQEIKTLINQLKQFPTRSTMKAAPSKKTSNTRRQKRKIDFDSDEDSVPSYFENQGTKTNGNKNTPNAKKRSRT